MPYQKLSKPKVCPLELAHKAGARRTEWYVNPAKPEVPGDTYCADCSRAKSAAKRDRKRALKATVTLDEAIERDN